MPGIPPEIEVYPLQHLPIIKAYADHKGGCIPCCVVGDAAGTVHPASTTIKE